MGPLGPSLKGYPCKFIAARDLTSHAGEEAQQRRALQAAQASAVALSSRSIRGLHRQGGERGATSESYDFTKFPGTLILMELAEELSAKNCELQLQWIHAGT